MEFKPEQIEKIKNIVKNTLIPLIKDLLPKNNEKQEIKHDLQKIQNNYFKAAMKNLEASNNLFYESARQLFSLTTFYLIFIATLFFFLSDKLDTVIFCFPVKIWITLAIISGTLSIILGIIVLWLDKIFLLHSARYYFKKSQKVSDYIKEKGQIIVDSIPKDLKIEKKQMVSSMLVNILMILQISLFIVAILLTMLSIIKAIIS